LQPHYAAVRALGAEMYGISVDSPAVSKQQIVQRLRVTFPILSDARGSDRDIGETIQEYEVWDGISKIAKPATFVIDRDGIIQWHDVGEHIGDRVFSNTILGVLTDLSQPTNTPPVISGTIPVQRVEAGGSLVVDLAEYASDEQDDVGGLQWEVAPSENDIFTAEINRHQLTIQPLPGAYGSARIRLSLFDSERESDSQSLLVRVIPAPNTQIEFNLTVPEGLSMFHLPVRVNSVNGAPQTILRLSDLFDVLGGSANVHWLVTGSADAPSGENELKPFFGGTNDSIIEAETGIFAALKEPRTLHLVGALLDAPLHLNPGWNIVGVPHYDSGIGRISDLAWTSQILNNASRIAVLEDGKFIANPPSEIFRGISSDRPIRTGQAILIEMTGAATIPLPLE
jgi:hypothetical protein